MRRRKSIHLALESKQKTHPHSLQAKHPKNPNIPSRLRSRIHNLTINKWFTLQFRKKQ